jgi:hypothetical protein
MRYYSTWQEALQDFIERFGSGFDTSFELIQEFEQKLGRNVRGAWFMYIGDKS